MDHLRAAEEAFDKAIDGGRLAINRLHRYDKQISVGSPITPIDSIGLANIRLAARSSTNIEARSARARMRAYLARDI